ncbi:hypothetical protein F183_A16920 [Bryobacterales bacterium F-183]|nr:hypothetical protein F183_A16920 [Bryobacterales bacterium F-183]
MNDALELPRPVMDDLAVLYVSGEASAETRELVEQYAAQHADYASALRAEAPEVARTEEAMEVAEMQALKRTKEYLFMRTLFFAMAVAFSLSLGLFTFNDDGVTFLLFRDAPGVFWAFSGVAVASWVAWGLMRRELAKTGL